MRTPRFTALILLLAALTVAMPSHAQWRYGLRLGGEFTHPTYESSIGAPWAKGGSGFAGGLTFEWQMPTTGLAIGASALYERRTINEHPGSPNATPWRLGRDYLAVPIDIKYKFWLNCLSGLAGPYVFTGPDLAMRLSKAESRSMNVGWNFGAGIDIINFLQISGGYRLGITDVTKHDVGIRDSGGFVSVAILFDF